MGSCAIFIFFLADTLGRRWSFVWTGIFMWFCMFYLGFYVRFDPPKKGAPISGAGYAALVFVYLFAAGFQFGWGKYILFTFLLHLTRGRLGECKTTRTVLTYIRSMLLDLCLRNLNTASERFDSVLCGVHAVDLQLGRRQSYTGHARYCGSQRLWHLLHLRVLLFHHWCWSFLPCPRN